MQLIFFSLYYFQKFQGIIYRKISESEYSLNVMCCFCVRAKARENTKTEYTKRLYYYDTEPFETIKFLQTYHNGIFTSKFNNCTHQENA